jgi:hypothetical protein
MDGRKKDILLVERPASGKTKLNVNVVKGKMVVNQPATPSSETNVGGMTPGRSRL